MAIGSHHACPANRSGSCLLSIVCVARTHIPARGPIRQSTYHFLLERNQKATLSTPHESPSIFSYGTVNQWEIPDRQQNLQKRRAAVHGDLGALRRARMPAITAINTRFDCRKQCEVPGSSPFAPHARVLYAPFRQWGSWIVYTSSRHHCSLAGLGEVI